MATEPDVLLDWATIMLPGPRALLPLDLAERKVLYFEQVYGMTVNELSEQLGYSRRRVQSIRRSAGVKLGL